MFKLSKRSIKRLEGVHPDLVAVIKRAIELTPIDFGISEGVRTLETQKQYLAEGKTTTLNSKHIINPRTNFGHAVDLYILVDNKVNWEHKHFRKVIQAVFTAAIEDGVQIKVGALWRDFLDSPHIELNNKYYIRD